MKSSLSSKEVNNYKKNVDIETRQSYSVQASMKYPESIPIILLRHKGKESDKISGKKYLFKKHWKVGDLLQFIRNKLDENGSNEVTKSSRALFLMVNGDTSPLAITSLGSLFNKYQDDDGFLYIVFSEERFSG